jgi:hypothetical protein
MNDRELLEAAAKAAGYRVRWVDAPTSFNYEGFRIKTGKKLPNGLDAEIRWNPLTDDGDALRLVVKLGFLVDVWLHQQVCIASNQGEDMVEAREEFGNDPCAATRRAIVRAAAIGKEMK